MTISSSYLEAFFAVSQTLNFTLAAQKLNITQSALSQRILNLENDLESSLFIRDRSGIKLTTMGSRLVRYCQIKNSLEEDFLNQIKSNNSMELAGVIKIGGFSSVMSSVILPALSELLKQNRKTKLNIISKEFDELFSLLKRGEIDFMILDDRIDRDELERVQLGIEKNVLVQSKNYAGEECYLDHDENDQVTINFLKKFKKSFKNIDRLYVDDIYGILSGVKLGIGKAVLPIHLIKDEKNIQVINSNEILEVPVYLYYYKQPYYTRLHQAIVKELTLQFKKHC